MSAFIKVFNGGQGVRVSVFVKRRSSKWLVCLHGIQSNKGLFVDLFKQSFLDDFSLLSIDFVGFGDSDKPQDFSYDIQDQAKIVEQIIKDLNIQELYLIGHSLGGMVGILLLNPLRNVIKSFINAEGNMVYADCGLSKDVADYNFEDFRNYGYEKVKKGINDNRRTEAIKKVPDFVFYKTSISVVDWAKSEKLLKSFKDSLVKKMFLYGDKNSEKANILPDSTEKAEVLNAGHFMLVDNPEGCYENIRRFLID